jgi:undecaprenyl-diphosphatase
VAFVHVAAYLHDYSFPSGHVIFYTTLFGLTFWVVWIAWKNSLLRNAVLVALAMLITVVGFSRVYLGEHWPSDVIGAYCLASLWVVGTIELLLALKPRLGAWWSGRPHRRRWSTLL